MILDMNKTFPCQLNRLLAVVLAAAFVVGWVVHYVPSLHVTRSVASKDGP